MFSWCMRKRVVSISNHLLSRLGMSRQEEGSGGESEEQGEGNQRWSERQGECLPRQKLRVTFFKAAGNKGGLFCNVQFVCSYFLVNLGSRALEVKCKGTQRGWEIESWGSGFVLVIK